ELAKPALRSEDAAVANATRGTLITVLDMVLRTLHPMIPFITEEIWQKLPKADGAQASLMLEAYPDRAPLASMGDDAAVAQSRSDVTLLMDLVTSARSLKAQFKISPAKPVPLHLTAPDAEHLAAAERIAPALKHLGRLSTVEAGTAVVELQAGRDVVRGFEVVLPLEDAGIDVQAERTRLGKEVTKCGKEIAGLTRKLDSEGFLTKAPPAVVEKERARLVDLGVTHEKLKQTLARLG
ncbi:MAG: class I tRNA ligase family protein, partial [Myxococcota bacterium]